MKLYRYLKKVWSDRQIITHTDMNRIEEGIEAFGNNVSKATVPDIETLKGLKYLAVGDIVQLNGYYTAGDGAHHKRKIENEDDGSGVQLANGLYANIVHNGEVNVSWFGAKGDGITDDYIPLQRCVTWSSQNPITFEARKIAIKVKINKDLCISASLRLRKNINIEFFKNTKLIKTTEVLDSYQKNSIIHIPTGTLQQDIVIKGSPMLEHIDGQKLGTYGLVLDGVERCNIEIETKNVECAVYGGLIFNSSLLLRAENCRRGIVLVGDATYGDTGASTSLNFSYVFSRVTFPIEIKDIVYSEIKGEINTTFNSSNIFQSAEEIPIAINIKGSVAGLRVNCGIERFYGIYTLFEGCTGVTVNMYTTPNNVMFAKDNNKTNILLREQALNVVKGSSIVYENINYVFKKTNGHNPATDIPTALFYLNRDASVVIKNGDIATDFYSFSNGEGRLKIRGESMRYFTTTENLTYKLDIANNYYLNTEVGNRVRVLKTIAISNETGEVRVPLPLGTSRIINFNGTPHTKGVIVSNFSASDTLTTNCIMYTQNLDGTPAPNVKVSVSICLASNLNMASTYDLYSDYYTTKMQQEGVYEDFISYMDSKTEYDRLQREAENQPEGVMMLPVLQEPQPSKKLLAFKTKYLG